LHAKYEDPQLHWSSYASRPGPEEVEHPASWSYYSVGGWWAVVRPHKLDAKCLWSEREREREQQTSGGT